MSIYNQDNQASIYEKGYSPYPALSSSSSNENIDDTIDKFGSSLKLILKYLHSCLELELQNYYNNFYLKHKIELNDSDLHYIYARHFLVNQFFEHFNHCISGDLYKGVKELDIDIKSSEYSKSEAFDLNTFDQNNLVFDYNEFNKAVSEAYIINPIKDKLNILDNLKKNFLKFESSESRRYSARGFSPTSKLLKKTKSISVPKSIFKATKMLSIFNIFGLLGSSAIDILLSLEDKDKKTIEFRSVISDIIEQKKSSDTFLAKQYNQMIDLINEIMLLYKAVLNDIKITDDVRDSFRDNFNAVISNTEHYFSEISIYKNDGSKKSSSDRVDVSLYWLRSTQNLFNTDKIKNFTESGILIQPQYLNYLKRHWLNSNTACYSNNITFFIERTTSRRDTEYLGPKNDDVYQRIAEDVHDKYWATKITSGNFAISQLLNGEFYYLGMWNVSGENKISIRKKILQEFENNFEKYAPTKELTIDLEAEFDINDEQTDFYLRSYATILYGTPLFGGDRAGRSPVAKLTLGSIVCYAKYRNENVFSSVDHSTLYSANYSITEKDGKSWNLSFTNTRNIGDS